MIEIAARELFQIGHCCFLHSGNYSSVGLGKDLIDIGVNFSGVVMEMLICSGVVLWCDVLMRACVLDLCLHLWCPLLYLWCNVWSVVTECVCVMSSSGVAFVSCLHLVSCVCNVFKWCCLYVMVCHLFFP